MTLFKQKEVTVLHLYFIDGLGSNHYYTTTFAEHLSSFGIQLQYLNLPDDLDHLVAWFENMISQEEVVYLAGFSLGADIANYLANHSRVDYLILLDGGLRVHDISQQSLEQEITDALSYLDACQISDINLAIEEEKKSTKHWSNYLEMAVRENYVKTTTGYQLKLSPDRVTNLLRTRRKCWLDNQERELRVETLLILAGQPTEYLEVKKEALKPYDHVTYRVLQDASHQLYLDDVAGLVDGIVDFLKPA